TPPQLVDRPADVPPEVAPPKLPVAPAEAGHVHAPSPAQAVTAAVLRSAWRSHGGDDALAVELSSRRVRLAEQLLDGVRAGQSLGALLGYRFERGLHDHPAGPWDQHLPLFRGLAPVRAHRVDPREDGTATVTATVESTAGVDGLELHRLHRAGALDARLAALPATARAAVGQVLADLAEATDAVADTLLAESVHQLALGDLNRAAAAVDAASGAATNPPELHVTRTPVTGATVTHRVLLVVNVDDRFARLRQDWPAARGHHPRIAGAAADALTAVLLPPSWRVFWRLRWHAPDGVTATPWQPASLDRMQSAAIDLLAAPPHPGRPDDAELDRRIALDAWGPLRPAGVGPDWTLQLDYDRDPGWPAERISLAEFLHAVNVLRDLYGRSRPVVAADLGPDPDVPPQVDESAKAQADETWQTTRQTRTALAALPEPDAAGWDEDVARQLLDAAAGLGVVGAVPPPPRPDGPRAVADTRRHRAGRTGPPARRALPGDRRAPGPDAVPARGVPVRPGHRFRPARGAARAAAGGTDRPDPGAARPGHAGAFPRATAPQPAQLPPRWPPATRCRAAHPIRYAGGCPATAGSAPPSAGCRRC
ncbi:hypothetical protein JNW87_21540, partial [Micromonospora sp. ATA51]|nr:hypothetical protein [Micromonospora sp. ATA51]